MLWWGIVGLKGALLTEIAEPAAAVHEAWGCAGTGPCVHPPHVLVAATALFVYTFFHQEDVENCLFLFEREPAGACGPSMGQTDGGL